MNSSSRPEVPPATQVDAAGHAPRLRALGSKVLVAILLAHFTVDMFAGYRPSLQRHLKEIWQLDNFWTAMLAVPGSLMVMCQPLFGLFSDRMRTRAFVVGGVLMTAVGYGVALPLAGLCSPTVGYCLALAGIWLGATGIAAYHPQGAALSGRASPKRSERAVALFVFGGTAGYAMGLFVPPLFIAGGYVPWISCLAGLGLAALALQMRALPRLRPPGERLTRPPIREIFAQLVAEVRPCFRGLFVLWLMVVLRAVALNCFLQFISIYHGEAHNLSKLAGAALAAGLMMSMALAGLVGVRASERFGMRLTLGLSFLSGVLVLIGSLGAARSGWIWPSYCLLILGGALLGGSVPINVAAGQKLLKRSAALGSGIMIGLGWGTGGLLVPLAAKIGELCGGAALQDRTAVTLLVAALMALPGAALALLLPKKTRPAG